MIVSNFMKGSALGNDHQEVHDDGDWPHSSQHHSSKHTRDKNSQLPMASQSLISYSYFQKTQDLGLDRTLPNGTRSSGEHHHLDLNPQTKMR